MARMNIYVPDDLKKEMDKRPDLNWSYIFKKCVQAILKDAPKRDILRVASKRRR